MDQLLGRLTSQAMNYAIRSGITITTTYAIKQCTHLVKRTPRSSQHRGELQQLQLRLESKIRILSPAIDMIELISARGNTTLESAVGLVKEIRVGVQSLGSRVAEAAECRTAKVSREECEMELASIVAEIKMLLGSIEDAIPLINLAITTSGVNLSTKLSGTISPSRLLQASTFLTAADSRYTAHPGERVQVGPTWALSLYMLFAGHANRVERETTWKEVIHKARVKLMRVPLDQLYDLPGEHHSHLPSIQTSMMNGEGKASEFAYQLLIVEDLDDDRVHTFDDNSQQPGWFEDVLNAGIRDVLPIHEVSKVFYADTGKILGIGGDSETNSPVLLMKRDVHAEAPRRMMRRPRSSMNGFNDDMSEINGSIIEGDDQSEIDAQIERESRSGTPQKVSDASSALAWRLPADLDPEWMAFEVYVEEPDSESDSEDILDTSRRPSSRDDSLGPHLDNAFSNLHLKSPSPALNGEIQATSPSKQIIPRIKTSLSLLEMLTKLTALQQFRQDSHLAIEDELLNFFLEDAATAGSGEDKEVRRKVRRGAVERVGFDPYDESPVKRRGAAYQEIPIRRTAHLTKYGFDDLTLRAADFVRPSIEQPGSSPVKYTSPSSPAAQETPSPASAPPATPYVSRDLRRTVRQAKYDSIEKSASQGSLLATPPSTTKFLRAQSEPKVRSPLAGDFVSRDHEDAEDDDALVTEE